MESGNPLSGSLKWLLAGLFSHMWAQDCLISAGGWLPPGHVIGGRVWGMGKYKERVYLGLKP